MDQLRDLPRLGEGDGPEPGQVLDSAEPVIEWLVRLCGWSAILFVLAIFLFVFVEQPGRWGTWTSRSSSPAPTGGPPRRSREQYGILALLAGTVSVTLLAMLLAVPFGLGAAVYISEFSSPKTKETLKIVIELLAAIPSVVWGFMATW